MPPIRGRRPRVHKTNAVADLASSARAVPGEQTFQDQNLQDNTPALSRDHAGNDASDSSFSEAQLNTIRELIQESITAASREIANEAALATVQVVQPNPPLSATTSICSQPTSEPLTQQQTPTSLTDVCKHAAPFQDIPTQYIKDIQSGEFFELSKLLPKHLSALDEEDNVLLTLDNSVVRVSKKVKPSTCITEIEQWTTAFTTYMSVFTHKFPLRSKELLQYFSLIRCAARVHKGLGWAIYDYKFRQKAGQNKTRVWSEVDQQLWLTIFTVAPSVLTEEYPLFFQRTPNQWCLVWGRTSRHLLCLQPWGAVLPVPLSFQPHL